MSIWNISASPVEGARLVWDATSQAFFDTPYPSRKLKVVVTDTFPASVTTGELLCINGGSGERTVQITGIENNSHFGVKDSIGNVSSVNRVTILAPVGYTFEDGVSNAVVMTVARSAFTFLVALNIIYLI